MEGIGDAIGTKHPKRIALSAPGIRQAKNDPTEIENDHAQYKGAVPASTTSGINQMTNNTTRKRKQSSIDRDSTQYKNELPASTRPGARQKNKKNGARKRRQSDLESDNVQYEEEFPALAKLGIR